MKQNYTPVLIFAVNKSTQTEDLGYLEGFLNVKPKCLQGSWEGQVEWSYLVPANNSETVEDVQEVARQTDQDSILYLDNERFAWLLNREDDYQLDKAVAIGRFQECSKDQAMLEQGYTFDIEKGVFYRVIA